jgi:hypothetical protein
MNRQFIKKKCNSQQNPKHKLIHNERNTNESYCYESAFPTQQIEKMQAIIIFRTGEVLEAWIYLYTLLTGG